MAGGLKPVRVRCPGCDETLTGHPRVVAVRRDSRSVTVTVDVPPIQHQCGKQHHPVGFGPNTSGGNP